MLKNKVVVITGASSGIGKAVALDCAKNKANTVLISRRKENLKSVESELKKYNVKTLSIPLDVSKKKNVLNAAKKVLKEFGKVDVLVNNAGIGVYGKLVEKDTKDIERVIQVNLFGAVYMIKAFLPSMVKRKSGHIVNVGSVLSKIGIEGLSDYSASKFGMSGLSEGLYQELKPLGINVSMIYPGYVKTNFHKHPSFRGRGTRSPLRGIEPDNVSAVILKALKEKKFEYFIPKVYGPLMKSKSLFPGVFRKIQEKGHE